MCKCVSANGRSDDGGEVKRMKPHASDEEEEEQALFECGDVTRALVSTTHLNGSSIFRLGDHCECVRLCVFV